MVEQEQLHKPNDSGGRRRSRAQRAADRAAGVDRFGRPLAPRGTNSNVARKLVTATKLCPRCGARPGDRCRGRNGPRERNHQERARG